MLDLQTALSRFVDTTGRPGPAGWQLGKYPAGAADLPVTGVSWFEAAAYAKFRGKSLPTVHHWRRAVGESITAPMTRFGNFSGHLQAVGQSGLGPFGTYDMIGNAAEWVSNAKGAEHLVSGGAATGPPYVGYYILSGVTQSPWDRKTLTGVRCATYLEPPAAPLLADLPPDELPPLPAPMPEAVLDGVLFGLNYRSFDADPRPLEKLRLGDISRQRVSLSADDGGGRFDVYVFTPNDAPPPYQAVLYFAGDYGPRPDFEAQYRWDLNVFEPILRSGRAVIWPIWYGTYSRYDGFNEVPSINDYLAVRNKRFQAWVRETAAVLEYLGAPEFSDKVGWLGLSYGAMSPMSMTYLFPSRFGAAILMSGGDLIVEPWQVTFYRRLHVPVLMLNGRYDPIVSRGQARRFYDGIGTPAEDKRLVLYETGHWPLPRNEIAREIGDWLDRYLGPVGTPQSNDTDDGRPRTRPQPGEAVSASRL